MKDRMIIIREGVVFIITVTHDAHEPQKGQEEQETDNTTKDDQDEMEFPYISISAN